jgi:CheY-like chemotaxis protein
MKKIVLIAEDDKAIVEVMDIILQEAGYETVLLKSGEKVVETVTSKLPNLLLLDIWLSGEDGGEIAKVLKAKEKTKHIPIVMISANNETEQIAKNVGADGFLRKPFDIDDFLQVVAKFTESK